MVARDELLSQIAAAEPAADSHTDPEQVAVWLFTSGTTGEPKAALLRHRHLVSYVLSSVDFMSSGEEEAALVSVPPYHIAGIAAILTGTYGGRRIVYLSQFDAVEWVGLAEAEQITHAMVVPTMLGRILDSLEASGARLPRWLTSCTGVGGCPSRSSSGRWICSRTSASSTPTA